MFLWRRVNLSGPWRMIVLAELNREWSSMWAEQQLWHDPGTCRSGEILTGSGSDSWSPVCCVFTWAFSPRGVFSAHFRWKYLPESDNNVNWIFASSHYTIRMWLGCYIYETVFEISLKIIVSSCSKNEPFMWLSPQSSLIWLSLQFLALSSCPIKIKMWSDFKGSRAGAENKCMVF